MAHLSAFGRIDADQTHPFARYLERVGAEGHLVGLRSVSSVNELLSRLNGNASVDWQHLDSARARVRNLVKRILRKYGYPPDLQEAAAQTVLQQAGQLSARWPA